MTSSSPAADRLDLGSSRRCGTPERTVDRARAQFRTMGITRLADITGLDRIGIPVWLAQRPNARSLSGGQGKGVTDAAAQASAVMETIETWHAERVARGELVSFEALGHAQALDPRQLDPGPDLDAWDVDQGLEWVAGEDLLGGHDVFVPRQAIDLDLTDLSRPRFLTGSTNGLASGNHSDEALVHGLYELVERDAERRWRLRPSDQRESTAVDQDEVAEANAGIGALLEQIRAADCDVAVFNCTGRTGIATYRCVIADRVREFRPLACSGVGAHGLAALALVRAITEAAQSRATLIAGSRDDRYPSLYAASFRAVWRGDTSEPPRAGCSYGDGVDELSAVTSAREIETILTRLAELGATRVAAVDLTRSDVAIPVIRVAAERFLLPGPFAP